MSAPEDPPATPEPAPPSEPELPPLYFACVANDLARVRELLEAGADPNDGESIYHAAELDHRECLELLLAHGADLGARHAHWQNTPLYFLSSYRERDAHCTTATSGMRWLLEHGADPNVTSYATQEAPLHRIAAVGRRAETTQMLLDHGATIDLPRADGRTPYVLAVRAGNQPVAELLLARGADPTRPTPVDRLLGACQRADTAEAHALLAAHPDLLSRFDAEDRGALAIAAELERPASLRLMRELGFDLAWEGEWGGTALHHAAWRGNVALSRELIAAGAPLDDRDRQYGCSPLGWAAHGSAHCRSADEDYIAILEALLAAGASREAGANRWGDPPEALASPGVAAFLRERAPEAAT